MAASCSPLLAHLHLVNDRIGDPPILRWLSVSMDGQVALREVDNRIGYSTDYQAWVQPHLVRDVYRLVDPSSRGLGGPNATTLRTERGIVVMTARLAFPSNPVAAEMLAEFQINWDPRGTVTWLGPRDPNTGLHADLVDAEELHELAVSCRDRVRRRLAVG